MGKIYVLRGIDVHGIGVGQCTLQRGALTNTDSASRRQISFLVQTIIISSADDPQINIVVFTAHRKHFFCLLFAVKAFGFGGHPYFMKEGGGRVGHRMPFAVLFIKGTAVGLGGLEFYIEFTPQLIPLHKKVGGRVVNIGTGQPFIAVCHSGVHIITLGDKKIFFLFFGRLPQDEQNDQRQHYNTDRRDP